MRRALLTIIVAALFAVAAPLEAAVAHVQTVKISDNTAGTSAVSASLTFSANSLAVLVVVIFDGETLTSTGGTLSGGGTFTAPPDRDHATGTFINVAVFSLPNVNAGAQTATATFSGTVSYATIFLSEFSSVPTVSPQDGTGAEAGGTSTAASTGAYSGLATSLYVTGVATDEAGTCVFTAGAGWTKPTNGEETAGATNVCGAIAYKANPGTTSHTGSFTTNNVPWAIVGVAYLEAAVAGTRLGPVIGVGP